MQGFTYVAPSVLEEMSHAGRIVTARSPRRTPRQANEHLRLAFAQRSHPMQSGQVLPTHSQHPHQAPHLQFAPRPSPQDEMMDVQGMSII